ncbi:TIGR02594 family protein [Methylopila sp. Yamaguchi]|uniref:TIGR02594 family protein n=1 Tax=Methylopila sp. Yamaguchi TaxID=1437817 RepID=UPI0013569A9C|nr:TIGR02594 family protein [Methylopila sp. Yamaguchi]
MPHKMYNVRPGDTLGGIAHWAGTPLAALLDIKPQIENPNLIFSGQAILLPEAVSRPKLLAAAAAEVYPGTEPGWFKIARREIGVAERDPGSNPRILEYLATTTLSAAAKGTDATAWCAAFVNWCVEMDGRTGLKSAWALDWKSFGSRATSPAVGDIVVFTRTGGSSSGGHVGFYVADLGNKISLLGGNQGNRVSISDFPKDGKKGPFAYKLVAIRRP